MRDSTASDHLKAISCIPGVGKTLAQKLLAKFGGFGGVVAATEEELLSVVGISANQAKRMTRFFGCKRGHWKYSEKNWEKLVSGKLALSSEAL